MSEVGTAAAAARGTGRFASTAPEQEEQEKDEGSAVATVSTGDISG